MIIANIYLFLKLLYKNIEKQPYFSVNHVIKSKQRKLVFKCL